MNKIYIFLVLVVVLITSCTINTVNTTNTNEVIIDESHQLCNIDDDCINVQTKCNGCECGGIPVNKNYNQIYADKYVELCNDYQGPQCDVMCALGNVKCINNKCTFVQEDILENDIYKCTDDIECIIVPYSSCCGALKKAINQKYLVTYNEHPEWQKLDNPEICALIGLCADDSNVTSAKCQDNNCVMIY